jgi:dTDP-glucose pyrophosphorylase
MNIVITMAGLGSRFREAGYTVPKFQIEAHGKTLFEWSMISLSGYFDKENKYFFIVRKEDDSAGFIHSMCDKLGIGNRKVIEIDALTDGQATTALLASEYWDQDRPLLVYNIDTFVKSGAMHKKEIRGDGFIPCFHAPGDHWSFVKLGSGGQAVEVREKQRISDNCTLGAYYFKTAALFEKIYEAFFSRAAGMEKGEKYIAPMYNYLIQNGGEVYISVVPEEDVYVLGTPKELQFFIENYVPSES